MNNLLAIAKALSDPSRLRLLGALRGGELCVCQMVELLELAPSTTSKHLSILAAAGLIVGRKEGRWVHYRLAGWSAPAPTREALQWALGNLEHDPDAQADARRLAQILAIEPETLCARQASGQRSCCSAPETPAEARWQKDSGACCTATEPAS
jgi:DNA-binding transcriptional ArsR family regulator